MSIKSEVIGKDEKLDFPCLMKSIHDKSILYATGEIDNDTFEGTCIVGGRIGDFFTGSPGKHLTMWLKKAFIPLPKGEIVKLQNE